MIARNETAVTHGLGPGGLHGYDSPRGVAGYGDFRYPVPTPVMLGDLSPEDAALIQNLASTGAQAFESTQPSAVAAATYGGNAGLLPGGPNSGVISFGGSTSILLLVGLGLAAWAFAGRRSRN